MPVRESIYKLFQSTPPMQGATFIRHYKDADNVVSIHAPYAGSDSAFTSSRFLPVGFNPRPLCRERQVAAYSRPSLTAVSIHAPYAGSDDASVAARSATSVSIHAPYAGSDVKQIRQFRGLQVSIHAPYAGSDGVLAEPGDGPEVSIHAPYAGSDAGCCPG